MKTVFVVTRYRLHEDLEIYRVFENWTAAVDCCRRCKEKDDGYLYDWDMWEVE